MQEKFETKLNLPAVRDIVILYISAYLMNYISDCEAVHKRLMKDLPGVMKGEVDRFELELSECIREAKVNMEDVCKAEEEYGWSPEMWFYKKIRKMEDDHDDEDFLKELWHLKKIQVNSADWIMSQLCDDDITIRENDLNKSASSVSKNLLDKTIYNKGMRNILLSRYQHILCLDMDSFTSSALDARMIAFQLSRNAVLTGVGGFALTTGIVMSGRMKDAGFRLGQQDFMRLLYRAGGETGLRQAVASALKVAAERHWLPFLNQATPVSILVAISGICVDNGMVMYDYANGNINTFDAVDRVGRISSAGLISLLSSAQGMSLGAAVLPAIPIGTTIIGPIIGGAVCYAMANKAVNVLYEKIRPLHLIASYNARIDWRLTKHEFEKNAQSLTRNVMERMRILT